MTALDTPTREPDAAVVDDLARRYAPGSLDALDVDGLRDRLAELRRLEGLVTAATARVTGRLARAGAVRQDGASSTVTWLQQQTGRSTREAARLERLSRRLDQLPRTAEAVEQGRITAEAADAVVRAADDGRLGSLADVDRSLSQAAGVLPPEKLRAEIRRRTQAADGAALLADERRQHANRRVTLTTQPDGMTALHGLLPPEPAERLRVALDALDAPDGADVPPELRRDRGQRLADALDRLATVALERADVDGPGRRVPQLTVTVDLATIAADLADPAAAPGDDRALAPDDPAWAGLPTGHTTFGVDLSPQAVRRLLCDAAITRVVLDGASLPLDVGRATRTWSTAQRKAAGARDRGCRGPACDRPPGWTELHHLHWWRRGGPTCVDNGLSLCRRCHRLVHDDGWTVRLEPVTGDAVWTSPDGAGHRARRRTA